MPAFEPRYEPFAEISSISDAPGLAIPLRIRSSVTFGRHPKCTYSIDQPCVSSLHCIIQLISEGPDGLLIALQDISTNGTLVNGFKIRKSSALLVDGDEVEIPRAISERSIYITLEANSKTSAFTIRFQGKHAKPNVLDVTQDISSKAVGNYIVSSHCLGSGTFASVQLALDPLRHRQVACKTICTGFAYKNDEREREKVMKEVEILKSLEHPNINKVLDYYREDRWIHIFLELAIGGDLFTYITAGGHQDCHLDEDESKYISFQLMKGLEYMHDLHVSHRDLKPENVLLYGPGPYPRVAIADFGLARQKSYQATLNVVGTVPYMPPEAIVALVNPKAAYVGKPADCWSLGCCIYSMLSGMHPFDRAGPTQASAAYESTECLEDNLTKSRILSGTVDYSHKLWKNLSLAKSLINGLLVQDPRDRITIAEALRSEWVVVDAAELSHAYSLRLEMAA